MSYFAHPEHPLDEHLRSVAERALDFASAFDSGEWGYLAGLWHDLGKFQAEFQRLLAGEKIAVEHSGAGAALAAERHLLPIAFVIAGHHAGLANYVESLPDGPKPLAGRLTENRILLENLLPVIPHRILDRKLPERPPFLNRLSSNDRLAKDTAKRRLEFWVRFLFSALTDADYLDTEAFLNPEKAKTRGGYLSPGELLPLLEAELVQKAAGLSAEQRRHPINLARNALAEACRRVAECPPGLFSLTAPTGAGKTLAAMLFALKHAVRNSQRRVIVVLPYTSIIEQNAKVYREVFGARNLIEHHSNYDPGASEDTTRHQLATENWDTPIIITTTVQFFESLFANRSSRCRKLHNIANSVVVLDEVQSLPPGVLLPILDALNELATNYDCSIVLSTATPPALKERPALPQGLRNVREIVPDPSSLARQLKRVRYHWPANETTWEDLADQIRGHPRALAVVHRRDDARLLATLLQKLRPDDPVFHLSALMCPAHRSEVLERVREVLASELPCLLVSTQLIEAGVDIDFPVLYRALAGLDSIVQAAGRCNREGRAVEGRVYVFRAPTLPPQGALRRGFEIMNTMLAANCALDPTDPEVCRDYFRDFYFANSLDEHGIQSARAELNFATVAREFRLIEDECTKSVIVPYGDAERRVNDVRRFVTREGLRSLQPYAVRIYPQAFIQLRQAGALDEFCDCLYAVTPIFAHLYDEKFGLTLNAGLTPDPAKLVI
jgi:CRISPR-associated endonuclease/helicase Cas3